jgi:hypothetical protein
MSIKIIKKEKKWLLTCELLFVATLLLITPVAYWFKLRFFGSLLLAVSGIIHGLTSKIRQWRFLCFIGFEK